MFKRKYKSHTVGRTEGEMLAQVTAAQWRPLHKCSSVSSLCGDDQDPLPTRDHSPPSAVTGRGQRSAGIVNNRLVSCHTIHMISPPGDISVLSNDIMYINI